METKSFPVPVLASLVSGTMLTNSFGDVHQCAEFVMGHPIWTHEFASKPLWEQMRAKVLEQHPDLDVDLSGVSKENWQEYVSLLVADLGETREIVHGSETREKDPLTTAREIIGPDKPIVAIEP